MPHSIIEYFDIGVADDTSLSIISCDPYFSFSYFELFISKIEVWLSYKFTDSKILVFGIIILIFIDISATMFQL